MVVSVGRIDILLSFNTGFYMQVKNRNQLIMNRKAVFFNYCAPRCPAVSAPVTTTS